MWTVASIPALDRWMGSTLSCGGETAAVFEIDSAAYDGIAVVTSAVRSMWRPRIDYAAW